MADLTVAEAEEHLTKWRAADQAVSRGQQYSMGSFSLSRADAATIRQQIDYWERKVRDLNALSVSPSDSFARRQPGVAVARVR